MSFLKHKPFKTGPLARESVSDLLALLAAILAGISTIGFTLYVAVYLCLYGGVVQFIEGLATLQTSVSAGASDIAWGIVRVACTTVAGVATFLVTTFTIRAIAA